MSDQRNLWQPKKGKYIWGSMEDVLASLRVAENGGDVAEVVDALEHWVPVEPTDRICTEHRAMALEFAPQWCTNTGYQDRIRKKNPCVMVDAWIGEPA